MALARLALTGALACAMGACSLGEPDSSGALLSYSERAAPVVTSGEGLSAAPPGTTWAGLGRMVLAVPDSWSRDATTCDVPHEPTVYFDDPGTPRCAAGRVRGVYPSVAFTVDLPVPAPAPGSPMLNEVARMDEAECQKPPPRPTEPRCEQTIWSLDSGVAAVVRADRRRTVERIVASVAWVPEALATVPFVEFGISDQRAARQLRGAGLRAVVPETNWPHYVTGFDPPAGSVVEDGAAVRLIVGDG